jgi:hypothetical protein
MVESIGTPVDGRRVRRCLRRAGQTGKTREQLAVRMKAARKMPQKRLALPTEESVTLCDLATSEANQNCRGIWVIKVGSRLNATLTSR